MCCVKYQDLPDGCFLGTRQGIINKVIDWFCQPMEDHSSQVLWLTGFAGSGKSAIARSIVDIFGAQNRCAWFFFEETKMNEGGPDRLFATISRQLAGLNESWRARLVKILESSMAIRESRAIQTQFDELMLGPASQLDHLGPILIVIDALDESGSRGKREQLLATLRRIPNLPPHFRFLITSRPEVDIANAFEHLSCVQRIQLDHEISTEDDMLYYVKSQLQETWGSDRGLVERYTQEIVSRSDRLFLWAAWACRHVKGDGMIGHDPEERIQGILGTAVTYFDTLYTTTLERHYGFQKGDQTYHRFQSIMGPILLLREPLSMNDLLELWYPDEDKEQAQKILSPLGSLLANVLPQDYQKPIRPMHFSFLDFLRDPNRSQKYYVHTEGQEEKLTSALFRVMKQLLRFNICSLETSYRRNSDVEDVGRRVTDSIPLHLYYACRYWANHLSHVPVTDTWLDYVREFMDNRLLFWFEVLSLSKNMDAGLRQLFVLQDWLEQVHYRSII
jgi:hypothetical protein